MSAVGARVTGDIHTRVLDGTGVEETLLQRDMLSRPQDAVPGGGTLLFQSRPADIKAGRSLMLLSLDDHKVTPWSPSSGGSLGRISRDGRWIAFVSDETGQDEVYVGRFPQGGEKWRVSTAGGRGPLWRGDGRELYYFSSDHYVMRVAFHDQPVPDIGSPVPLFRTQLREFLSDPYYDVTADGQRFLLTRPVHVDAGASLTLEQGWSPVR